MQRMLGPELDSWLQLQRRRGAWLNALCHLWTFVWMIIAFEWLWACSWAPHCASSTCVSIATLRSTASWATRGLICCESEGRHPRHAAVNDNVHAQVPELSQGPVPLGAICHVPV